MLTRRQIYAWAGGAIAAAASIPALAKTTIIAAAPVKAYQLSGGTGTFILQPPLPLYTQTFSTADNSGAHTHTFTMQGPPSHDA